MKLRIAAVITLSSVCLLSCSVEKRLYTRGYYFQNFENERNATSLTHQKLPSKFDSKLSAEALRLCPESNSIQEGTIKIEPECVFPQNNSILSFPAVVVEISESVSNTQSVIHEHTSNEFSQSTVSNVEELYSSDQKKMHLLTILGIALIAIGFIASAAASAAFMPVAVGFVFLGIMSTYIGTFQTQSKQAQREIHTAEKTVTVERFDHDSIQETKKSSLKSFVQIRKEKREQKKQNTSNQPKYSMAAVASFVLGILGFIALLIPSIRILSFPISLVGILMAKIAKPHTESGEKRGNVLRKAGVTLNIVLLSLLLLFLLIVVILILFFFSALGAL